MSLGSEILALKRGYILDSATVNLRQEDAHLYYLGQDLLLHISPKKVDVYHFSLKMESKPYRIILYPTDSISLNSIT